MRSQRSFRVVFAMVLVGLVAASVLSPFHFLEENIGRLPAEVSADGGNCQPGSGYGLVPDHARKIDARHACVVCKIFNGALHVRARLTMPLFKPALAAADSRGVTPHFTGFSRSSRSPPHTA